MVAAAYLDQPQTVNDYKLRPNRRALGTTFKAEQKKVGNILALADERIASRSVCVS